MSDGKAVPAGRRRKRRSGRGQSDKRGLRSATQKIETTIDSEGFRPNVGIIVINNEGQVLWARRVGGKDAWQFPQGGINLGETPEQALYRELYEEVGLKKEQVRLLASTRGWLRYRLPKRLVRRNSEPRCIGQKQKWFLLRLEAPESSISFDNGYKPEFDHWRWATYWHPLTKVVSFKREVYRRALLELAPHQIQQQKRGMKQD
ncbi:RNA pyrophosphohydrolase [Biformimicrobium ophioploci]|uniref:RNA pyrophosphohydrolase n=1 Tax=Biformimicrobium ophioploci TaxID=3036711 RepID=A0ABQ6M0K1_9GAMM|nr:RNA pyrophosphohydrolase [Microbulbifer sp. NKW57]